MSQPRILFVDDEVPFRDLVASVLEKAGLTCLVAGDGLEALEKAEEYLPDLVLLDMYFPKLTAVQVCQSLRAQSDVPIIIYTGFPSPKQERELYAAGADEFLSKTTGPCELVEHIKAVLRRSGARAAEQAEATQATVPSHHLRAGDGHPPELTPRENEVACLLVQGKSNKEIAEHLFVSPGTVRNMLSNMFIKLDARNRAELVAKLVARQR